MWHVHTLTNIRSRCLWSDLNEVPCCRPVCFIHIVDSLALSQCCRVSYPPFSGPPWSPRPHSLTHTACVQTTDSERYKGPGLVSSAVNTEVLLTALHKNPTIRSFLTNRSLHRSHVKPYFKTNSGVTLMREIVCVFLSGLNSQTLRAFFKQTSIS